ncbi:MAG: glycosyltransferase family 2 protein [Planctomycetota bacterium]|jgi:glycosyltransferase involved in cell wall biosynthesis
MSSEAVSLVIPGRNCEQTIQLCLDAVAPLLETSRLGEIIFVDDGSTDDTAEIVAEFPVSCVPGGGRGPGAARNFGWRAARHPLVWFVDADCVAEPDALSLLLPHLDDPKVGGVSGSYGIMNPESLLACLIHEEIVERHRVMPQRVDFLATFNVVYRREILDRLDGFDERFLKGQDAELSWRVLAAGYELRFAFESRVKHFHATRLGRYLRTQRQQGYWRVWLHLTHAGHATGDTYSSWVDHMQPPLAMLVLASAPLVLFGRFGWISAALAALLLAVQVPMTYRLLRRLGRPRYVWYVAMSFIRAFWRGVGMTHGMLGYLLGRR